MKSQNTADNGNLLKMNTSCSKDNSLLLLNSIIEELPLNYSEFIDEAFKHKRIPKEYLLSSILFTISTSTGLTFYLDALGYRNYGNLYFTIIGSRGDAKSEAMKIATRPIKILDDKDYNVFSLEMKAQNSLDKNEPIRKRVIVQNATIEAAHKIHFENQNSIGICLDEVYSLIEKMGNPNSRDGLEWRTFLLEGYTNGYIDISRKTTTSFRINNAYPCFLGGLQHQFIPKLFANGNLESGFIDRLLFTPKLTNNIDLSRSNISKEVTRNYHNSVSNILDYKRQSEQEDEPIKQFKIMASKEALEQLYFYTQELVKRQQEAPLFIAEYMSKMQISIHKLCIVIFMMKHSFNYDFRATLDIGIVKLAIDLNEFYLSNYKIILEHNPNDNNFPTTEQIIKLAKKNRCSQKAVAEITGLHKSTISKKW